MIYVPINITSVLGKKKKKGGKGKTHCVIPF